MKTFQKILIAVAVLLSVAGCKNMDKRLAGEWKGMDNTGTPMSFVFGNEHSLMVISNNTVIAGGGEAAENGRRIKVSYEINESKKPMWLDVVFYDADQKKEIARATGVFRFITDKKMELRIDFTSSHTRFDKFEPNDEAHTLVLEKVS